jgi:hypothetical protein
MTAKPKARKAPMSGAFAQALARHKIAQTAIDAHFGMIDDVALANQLFDAERDALEVLAEMPCASDAEFFEKLRFLLARETHLWGSPAGNMEFGSIAVAVDGYFNQAKPA